MLFIIDVNICIGGCYGEVVDVCELVVCWFNSYEVLWFVVWYCICVGFVVGWL